MPRGARRGSGGHAAYTLTTPEGVERFPPGRNSGLGDADDEGVALTAAAEASHGSLICLAGRMEIRIDDDALALIESKGGVVALDFIAPVG